MTPLFLRTGHRLDYATPARGAFRGIDDPVLSIRIWDFAPVAVQRQAQAAGVNHIVKITPKGLVEALERAREGKGEVTRSAKPKRPR